MTTKLNARRVRGIAAVAVAAVATLALAGYARSAASPIDASAPTSTAAGPTASDLSARPANAVTVTSIDDTTLTAPNGRPAVLFFFTVGCGECETGGQALAQARAQAPSKADFLLVDLNPSEPRPAIDYFRQAVGDPALPVVTANSVDLAARWKITQLSTAIVLDKTGTVAYRAIDPSAQDLLTAIDKAAQ